MPYQLGDAPIKVINFLKIYKKWQRRLDSNQRMSGSKPDALPTWRRPYIGGQLYRKIKIMQGLIFKILK